MRVQPIKRDITPICFFCISISQEKKNMSFPIALLHMMDLDLDLDFRVSVVLLFCAMCCFEVWLVGYGEQEPRGRCLAPKPYLRATSWTHKQIISTSAS